MSKHVGLSLISNCRRVLNAVLFLLDNFPASELPMSLPRRKHTACGSVIICETILCVCSSVASIIAPPKILLSNYRCTALLPNVKNILGHFHGEIQNFLETPVFSTLAVRCTQRMLTSSCLFILSSIKRKCPIPDDAARPRPMTMPPTCLTAGRSFSSSSHSPHTITYI